MIVIPIPDTITDEKDRRRYYVRHYNAVLRKMQPDRTKEIKKRCYLKHQNKNQEYAVKYQAEHPEVKKRNRPKYKAKELTYKRTSKYREWEREYSKRPHVRAREYHINHIRRAKQRGVVINLTSVRSFIESVRLRKKISCYYCGTSVRGCDVHIDHIAAISKGGNHSIENICASCPKCNLNKSAKSVAEWQRVGQQVFNL